MSTIVIPFKALNPNYKKCSIQGRVFVKKTIHEYTNQWGPEKLFGFDLLYCSGEEIHVYAFKKFVDSFYALVEIGTLYIVSNGTIKTSNPSYNHLNNHLQIILSSTSTIHPYLDGFPSIRLHSFHFKTINDFQILPSNSMVDLIGMVISVFPASTIWKKRGSQTSSRTIFLKDTSCLSIDDTLWVHHCHNEGSHLASLYSSDPPPILAIKRGCHSYIYRFGEYIAEGPEWNLSATTAKISENIGKCRFALKNTKINIFFQFFLTSKATTTSNKHIST